MRYIQRLNDKNKDVNKSNEIYTKAKQHLEGTLIFIFMFIVLKIRNMTK